MSQKQPIIQIRNLEKSFYGKEDSVTALKNINLEILEGEIYGIIGLSGAGKSTLVRCMNLLERPTAGSVVFGGRDLASLSARELGRARQSIGMIFQQFNLLMQRTALQNICFPLELAGMKKAEAKARARELLHIVGLPDKEKAYPAQLSGGQKQRIAIARALSTNPKVLLCDEATSALDPTTTRSILTLLQDINQKMGITIVIITHEMKVIEEICQKVAIIDRSQIAEFGQVQEIFSRPKSKIAKKLVFSGSEHIEHFNSTDKRRIVFDGRSSYEPIISNMILECKASVNILFAESKNVDGKAVGEMVIQLPSDSQNADRLIRYLDSHQIYHEEVE